MHKTLNVCYLLCRVYTDVLMIVKVFQFRVHSLQTNVTFEVDTEQQKHTWVSGIKQFIRCIILIDFDVNRYRSRDK